MESAYFHYHAIGPALQFRSVAISGHTTKQKIVTETHFCVAARPASQQIASTETMDPSDVFLSKTTSDRPRANIWASVPFYRHLTPGFGRHGRDGSCPPKAPMCGLSSSISAVCSWRKANLARHRDIVSASIGGG